MGATLGFSKLISHFRLLHFSAFCQNYLNVMPSTLPLYPLARPDGIQLLRILKSAALKETIWPFFFPIMPPSSSSFTPHAVCIAKNFPRENVVKKQSLFFSLNIRKFCSKFS